MNDIINYSALTLILLNGLSFLAPYHWLFDLLVHFKIQYFLLGIILGILCLVIGSIPLAIAIFTMSAFCFYQIQSSYKKIITDGSKTGNFILVQFNKFYFNRSYNRIFQWLLLVQPDIVLINEPLPDDIEAFKVLMDVFPHQYPETTQTRFNNILVLSRYNISVSKTFPGKLENKRPVLKIGIEKPGLESITVYAHHAAVPAGAAYFNRRNEGLKTIAMQISDSTDKNIILAGDWNMTSFSPHFKDILNISGLTSAKAGWLPQTTWPSFALLPWLKIPIDHVLFNKNLHCSSINKGPALGSDHHPLVAQFYVNKTE